MQTLQDNRATMITGEGVPQRRASDQPLEWIEEGPHATLMTPARVLAILGTFPNGDNMAQNLAEQVEIDVRRALAGEMGELIGLARMVAMMVAEYHKRVAVRHDPEHPLHHNQVLAQLAQRLCLRHGYSETGAELTGEPPILNPEMMLERLEQGQRDFGNTYRWLRSEAQRAGFNYICEAIACAAQAKKGGA